MAKIIPKIDEPLASKEVYYLLMGILNKISEQIAAITAPMSNGKEGNEADSTPPKMPVKNSARTCMDIKDPIAMPWKSPVALSEIMTLPFVMEIAKNTP